MVLPPALIVHGLAMARDALATAAGLGRPVTLLSAEAAGAYAGVGWWQALVAAACQGQGDGQSVPDILDCGPAPGRALEALRAGQRLLVLEADPRVWADIAERAQTCGGLLLPHAPPALDLAVPGAHRRLHAWLQQPPSDIGSRDTGRTFG